MDNIHITVDGTDAHVTALTPLTALLQQGFGLFCHY